MQSGGYAIAVFAQEIDKRMPPYGDALCSADHIWVDKSGSTGRCALGKLQKYIPPRGDSL